MASLVISVAVGVLTFGLGVLGLYLKRLVPERHMSAGSRDMIGAVIGLLSLLLALVLGTLVGSAYGFFATQKGDIESLCARSLELDLAFRQYGPETKPLREALRDSMQEALDAIRGDRAAYQRHFELGGYMSKFEQWNQTLSSLSPRSPAQTALASSMGASSAAFQQTRLLMSLQLASPISWPLIIIVVSWAMLLFFGFGVISGLNPTSLGALAFGSFAVASAIFLILELNQPFSGLFRVPTVPIERAIAALGSSSG
jgi:ABC-type multidrug transport system fused ATPase/permease subunit